VYILAVEKIAQHPRF